MFQHKKIVAADNISFFQRLRCSPKSLGITNFWIFVLPVWDIKLSFLVYAIKTVVAGFIQIDCSGSSFCLGKRFPIQTAHRIKHLACVFVLFKIRNHIVNMFSYLPIHIDKFRITVRNNSFFRL